MPDSSDDSMTDQTKFEAGFLVALLVKYPEIGSLRASPEEDRLRLTFLLERAPDEAQILAFRRKLDQSLSALRRLMDGAASRVTPEQATVRSGTHEGLAVLHVERELSSLVLEELPLIIHWVNESFAQSLIVEDAMRSSYEYDADDDFLAHSLDDLRSLRTATLFGFRDDGRVLVFNESRA